MAMPQASTGLQDVRRQRVARKAGQNMGAGGNLTNHANLAAVYAPMVFVENQNMLNTIQH